MSLVTNLAVYNALNNNYLAYRMGKIDDALKKVQRYDEDHLNKIHKHKKFMQKMIQKMMMFLILHILKMK